MPSNRDTIAFYEEILAQHQADVENLMNGLVQFQGTEAGELVNQTAERIIELEARIAKLNAVIAVHRAN